MVLEPAPKYAGPASPALPLGERESAMTGNYWTSVMQARLGRRRGLTAAGAASAAGAFIAACGGGTSSGPKQPASKMVAPVTDETPNVKRGGSLKIRSTLEHPTLD